MTVNLEEKIPFITESDINSPERLAKDYGKTGFVFFGSGISSSKGPSLGLGFEYLELLMAAALTARKAGSTKVVQLLSDMDSGLNKEDENLVMETIVPQIKNILDAFSRNSSLNFTLVLSSGLRERTDAEIARMREDNPSSLNSYTLRQLADTECLWRSGAIAKCGWKQSSRTDYTMDEQTFNNWQKQMFPDSRYNFAYIPCANGLDGNRFPPYTVTDRKQRFVLGESVEDKLNGILADSNGKADKNLRRFFRRMSVLLPAVNSFLNTKDDLSTLPEDVRNGNDARKVAAAMDRMQRVIDLYSLERAA